ncbi:cysteine desulfurase-like protein, partial [Vibrio alginolyticus]|nr:cysteine desulfurase-like protein [Vibrio alginolyticus]
SFEGLAGVAAAVEYLAQFGDNDLPLRQRLEQSYALYNQHEQRLSERFLQRLDALEGVKLYGIESEDCQQRTPTFALTFDKYSPEFIA